MYKAIKGALSPAVWAAGTLVSPIVAPLATGAAAGMVASENHGKIATVAAGTAGTVGGTILGTLGAPVIGAACAHVFVHGLDELSDQSDDEQDPESFIKYINA